MDEVARDARRRRVRGWDVKRYAMSVLVLGALLVGVPKLAVANVLLNGDFETTVAVESGSSGFPVPPPAGTPDFRKTLGFPGWAASAHNSLAGLGVETCSSTFFGPDCAGRGTFASLSDVVPAGVLPRPVAIYQTVQLVPNIVYSFGGDFALRFDESALGLITSEAYLRVYLGDILFSSSGVPTGAGGPLLGEIDLSPSRFAEDDFTPVSSSIRDFSVREFEKFESFFQLTGATPLDVTMQLVVLASVPPNMFTLSQTAERIKASTLNVYADDLFINRTNLPLQPEPVPAPGALGLFALGFLCLLAARRRKRL